MYKKLLFTFLFSLFPFLTFCQSKIYNEDFDYSSYYCPGDPQYDHWVDYVTSFDTLSEKYHKMTMKGTFDMVGKSCTDKYAVRQIADALSNGYSTSVLCDGETWSVSTGCSAYNCGNQSDYIELTIGVSCNCGWSYTVRPCINTNNWGGINTETCNNGWLDNSQTMIVEVAKAYGNDNLASLLPVPLDGCSNNQAIVAKISNLGMNAVKSYFIGYSINGVNQTPVSVSNSIGIDSIAYVVLNNSFDFTANTTYDFVIWTYDPNGNPDSDPSNDTIKYSYFHTGAPEIPTAGDFAFCGVGRYQMSASSDDTIAWYDKASGGNYLGMGTTVLTPYLHTTNTFYVEAERFKSIEQSLKTGYHVYTGVSGDPSEYNGVMIEVKGKKNELLKISGITVNAYYGKDPTVHFKVYAREGGYIDHESDSTEWTRIFDNEVDNMGSFCTIPFSMIVEPGKSYGLYITTDPTYGTGDDIWIDLGGHTYSNSDLSLEGGIAVYGKFGNIGYYGPYTLDCEVKYEKACVSTGREPVVVTINPRPFGSELLKGNVFKGQYKLGIKNQEDIAELGKQLTYELTPPSGYVNSDYGNTWTIGSYTLETISGVPVNSSLYSFTNPGANGNGILTFIPDVSLLDSNIRINFNISDLGPYYCDTILNRYIHVAPTPKPNFTFPNIVCVNDVVDFTNMTSVHSGFFRCLWDFDNGDTSDFLAPSTTFQAIGTYNVKLTVYSDPYNVVSDTTIVLKVGMKVTPSFKVFNACEGDMVKITNQTPATTGLVYTWDFGDNTPVSNVTNPVHYYATANEYPVSLTTDLYGCIAKYTRNAYVYPMPKASFTIPNQVNCTNTGIQLNNTSKIGNNNKMGQLWDFSDGNNATIINPIHTFQQAGNYLIKLKVVSEFGCTDTLSKSVSVRSTPMVDFRVNKLCKNDISDFINLSSEFQGVSTSYTWNFSDGGLIYTKNVAKGWSGPGTKTVTLKSVLSNGCQNEVTKELEVLNQADAQFDVANVCENMPARFVNKSTSDYGDISYTWLFGDNSQPSSDPNPIHQYNVNSTTTYTTILVANVPNWCPDSAFRQVTINKIPVCDFNIVSSGQAGPNQYQFTPANSNYDQYEWLFGDGGSSTDVSPKYQYLVLGHYTVTLKATDNDCECTKTIKVAINQTGINGLTLNNYRLYPNPTDQYLTIEFEGIDKAQISIYNSVGQKVVSEQIEQSGQSVFTGNLSSGIYTAELNVDGVKSIVKLSIVH